MPTNAILINGPDITIPGLAVLSSLTPGRLVAIGQNFELVISDISAETAAILSQVSKDAVPETVPQRTDVGGLKAKFLILGPVQEFGVAPMVLQIGLDGTPDAIAIRILASDLQTANLQEWCAVNGDPFIFIDKDGALNITGGAANQVLTSDASGKMTLRGKMAYHGVATIPNGVTSGNVSGLGLDFTPSGVVASANSVDAFGDIIAVNVPWGEDLSDDGFAYYLSGVPQDGSKLAFTCIP